ncbi:MAG TPA: hypothetical protein VK605_00745, partial [Solirubrobacteraceae bacterium]|nr:hypothetical protein [Solirubrobacteraceae bacterium]
MVPVVLASGERTQARFDVVPATFVLERTAYRLADESTAASPANATIELCHELILEAYVQTHGHKVTHEPLRVAAVSVAICADAP